ncbi:MAG: hypothetical protein AAF990_13050 [Bacteroidota bacterium]
MLFRTFFLLFLMASSLCRAQSDSTNYNFGDFGGIIYLDSLVVSASRLGFEVDDFIQMVREDDSFFNAFHNLRSLSYKADNTFEFFNKRGKTKATYQSRIQQFSDGDCRQMTFLEKKHSGNFYKRKNKYRYYTAKMFDRIFLTYGTICESKVKVSQKPKGIQKHIEELKKLIFQPGEPVDVPLISQKLAIFRPEMAKYYHFKVSQETYQSAECYVFTAEVRPEYLSKKKGKTVIKYLQTYFDKDNFQVVARNYRLAYNSPLFDFDVRMQIELTRFKGRYAPTLIKYDGQWDIPAKKPEIAQFSLRFYAFGEEVSQLEQK